nr:MAG TPA: hypothetical protein [Caudoviricetes sp.]
MSLDGRNALAVYLGDYRGPRNARVFRAYCEGRFARESEEYLYRVYVTESIKMQGEGKCPSRSWADMARPRKEVAIDPRETICRITKGAGLEAR